MPNCIRLTGRDRRRAAHISTRQAGLLRFIAPTSRYARYGAPTVFSSPQVVFRQSVAQWRDLRFPLPLLHVSVRGVTQGGFRGAVQRSIWHDAAVVHETLHGLHSATL